jgi:hypothetical protein
VLITDNNKDSLSKQGQDSLCGGQAGMSKTWMLCHLDNLMKHSQEKGNPQLTGKYAQLKELIGKENYYGLVWDAELKDGKLNVDIGPVDETGKPMKSGDTDRKKPSFEYPDKLSINLQNPVDALQKRVTATYFRNLEQSLAKRGIPAEQISPLLAELKDRPDQIVQVVLKYIPNFTSIAYSRIKEQAGGALKTAVADATAKAGRHITQQVGKRVSNGLINEIFSKGITGAIGGSPAGPVGAVVGFLGAVAFGMVTDLVDTAVNTVFPSIQAGTVSGTPLTADSFRKEANQAALSMEKEVQAVQGRTEKENRLLGDDQQRKDEARMDALAGILEETVKVGEKVVQVDQKVDGLRADIKSLGEDMLRGIQSVSVKLEDIHSSITAISAKIDRISERLDAAIKADFDNGVESLALFDNTQDVQHLNRALDYFRNFKNTFERISQKSPEEKQLLDMSRYYLAVVYADLYTKTQNSGYAQSSAQTFKELIDKGANLDFLTTTYLSMKSADILQKAAAEIYNRHLERICTHLRKGELDAARQSADSLQVMVNTPNSAALQKAVSEYIRTGSDSDRLPGVQDGTYRAISAFVNSGKTPAETNGLPEYLIPIFRGTAGPEDFNKMLGNYKSGELVRFSVRNLTQNGYYTAALKILQQYPVHDDAFRVKAFLKLYNETNSPKFPELKTLVLQDPTYPQEVKDFAAKL